MKLKGRSYYIRKAHRYLGVLIGIQFIFWTIGGLYFSWTTLHEIHGDHLRRSMPQAEVSSAIVSPADAIKRHISPDADVDPSKIRIVSIAGAPHYSIVYSDDRYVLVNATSGYAREPIGESEAREIAAGSMVPNAEIESVEHVTKDAMSGHHEYREKPLPAWAVTFAHPENATAYIGVNDGQVHAVRTNNWRTFDLLWMLHTMDFAGRDNINNYLLRAFSILGLTTVLSGFLLFFISSKTIRRFARRA